MQKKGIHVRSVAGLLLATVFLTLSASVIYSSNKVHRFGIEGFGTSKGAQVLSMYANVIKEFATKFGYKIDITYFNDNKEMQKSLKDGKLEVFYDIREDVYLNLMENKEYVPFLAYSIFDMNKFCFCIYVQKNSKFKSISDLSGARMVTYDDAFYYYLLRRMTEKPPEDFFSSVKIAPEGVSIIYSLSMGEVDAGFVSAVTMEMARVTNPGPYKMLRKISCSDEITVPPIFRHKNAEKDMIDRFISYSMTMASQPEMKRFSPLMKSYKFQSQKVSRDDYQATIKILKAAEAKGWNKDYLRWIKSASATTK